MSTRVSEFSIEVPAKWVLSGEHSVLRGKSAVAFPLPRFSLKLSVQKKKTLSISPNPFQSQIRSLIGRALEFLNADPERFTEGEIAIESNIPIGAGLGSSAALCVAIARLAIWKTGSDLARWIPLATRLEDVFHGKSSGMDVNAIAHGKPILFSVDEGARPLEGLASLPAFAFYDSGIRGNTRDCIERVKHWQAQHPHLKDRFDTQMQEASDLARSGLLEYQKNREAGLRLIRRSMELSEECLETWGLVTPELLNQKSDLLRQGALAVKLTGAGLGGFWVALWAEESRDLDK